MPLTHPAPPPADPCSRESHQARIARDSQWAQMLPIGEQVVPAYEDEPRVVVALKQCPDCASTLGREVRQ